MIKINNKKYKINIYSGEEYGKLIKENQQEEKFITISELDKSNKPNMRVERKRKPSKIELMLQTLSEKMIEGFSQLNSRMDRLETRMDKFEKRFNYVIKANKLKDLSDK